MGRSVRTGVLGVEEHPRGVAREERAEGIESVYFLPWWVFLTCLAASAFAAYLLLERTQAGDSPWALFPLTAVLAPVVLVGAVVAAITLSTLLSTLLEDRIVTPRGTPEPPTRTEGTVPEATTPELTVPEATTPELTVPATTTPSASPDASPTASSSASPSP